MGKKSRKLRHSQKMARKRTAKATRRAAYAALAGTSRKAKRRYGSTMPSGRKHAHAMVDCGNIGCRRCYAFGQRRTA